MWGDFLMRKRREDDEFSIIEALYASEKSSVNRTRIPTSILMGRGESRGEIHWCHLHYLVLFVKLIDII
jgi:hypothetical protein